MKHSQRKCCEGNKKKNLHNKKLRERNFYSVFTMNVGFFLPSQCFGVKFHVKNVGLTGHGISLVSREPDPYFIYTILIYINTYI